MKRSFFKAGLFLALGLTTAVFFSCDKDDESSESAKTVSEIKATDVKNGNDQIVTVKAFGYDFDNDEEVVFSEADYINDGFMLKLPESVDDKYLELLSDNIAEGVILSDEKANVLFLYGISGYNEDDDEIGWFSYGYENEDSEHYVSWCYSDRDLTITGGFTEKEEDDEGNINEGESSVFNMNIKKGWNVMYEIEGDNDVYTVTSKKPSGIDFSWSFYSYGSYSYVGSATESVKNSNSFFLKNQRK